MNLRLSRISTKTISSDFWPERSEPGATCYRGVRELQQGQSLRLFKHGEIEVNSSGVIPNSRRNYRSAVEYLEEFEELHTQATKSRVRTNHRIVGFLSGGLDSSYVSATASLHAPQMSAMTLFVPGTRHLDERNYARLVSERSGIALAEIDTTECWYFEQPMASPRGLDQPGLPGAGASLRKLSHEAREIGAGVILGGEGGDEWFGGLWSR